MEVVTDLSRRVLMERKADPRRMRGEGARGSRNQVLRCSPSDKFKYATREWPRWKIT